MLVRCCTASWPRGFTAASPGEEKGRERQEAPQRLGNTICLLAKSSQEMLGRRESFCFPGRGPHHCAAEKRFPFHAAPKTSVRWVQRFRVHWLAMALS